ncbi:hypothetical protein [Brevibacterium litoralis]|uniref:hypothetical protein n=1 Tax=Brevibacterium litoralis TaxID=3138935 RepID=UPI0032EC1175
MREADVGKFKKFTERYGKEALPLLAGAIVSFTVGRFLESENRATLTLWLILSAFIVLGFVWMRGVVEKDLDLMNRNPFSNYRPADENLRDLISQWEGVRAPFHYRYFLPSEGTEEGRREGMALSVILSRMPGVTAAMCGNALLVGSLFYPLLINVGRSPTESIVLTVILSLLGSGTVLYALILEVRSGWRNASLTYIYHVRRESQLRRTMRVHGAILGRCSGEWLDGFPLASSPKS